MPGTVAMYHGHLSMGKRKMARRPRTSVQYRRSKIALKMPGKIYFRGVGTSRLFSAPAATLAVCFVSWSVGNRQQTANSKHVHWSVSTHSLRFPTFLHVLGHQKFVQWFLTSVLPALGQTTSYERNARDLFFFSGDKLLRKVIKSSVHMRIFLGCCFPRLVPRSSLEGSTHS